MNRIELVKIILVVSALIAIGCIVHSDYKNKTDCYASGGDAVVGDICMKLTPVKGAP